MAPAAAVLTSVAVRTAAIIRCMAVAYVIIQAAIWHAYLTAAPWRMAAPAAAVVWGAAFVIRLSRHRPAARLATADSVAHIPLALSTAWAVPPPMRGDVANWLYILLAGQAVIPLWFAPPLLGAPLVLASGAAYWAGAASHAAAPAVRSAPGASAMLLYVVGVVAWFGYHMLRHRARLADAALAAAGAAEHEQYVVLSRSTERREHERLIHDTVLNTLTALAREETGTGDTREIVARCRHDVALMEYVLSSSAGTGAPPPGAGRGLVAGIGALAAEMRTRGLRVHLEVTAPATGGAAIPVPVAVAISRAVRECLANVARHAGTSEAWLGVHAHGVEAAAGHGGLVVTVRDHGVGFQPDRVHPDRLGLRRSVVERVTDCGGSVSVRSAPGAGTTVVLCWPEGIQRLPGASPAPPMAHDHPHGSGRDRPPVTAAQAPPAGFADRGAR